MLTPAKKSQKRDKSKHLFYYWIPFLVAFITQTYSCSHLSFSNLVRTLNKAVAKPLHNVNIPIHALPLNPAVGNTKLWSYEHKRRTCSHACFCDYCLNSPVPQLQLLRHCCAAPKTELAGVDRRGEQEAKLFRNVRATTRIPGSGWMLLCH